MEIKRKRGLVKELAELLELEKKKELFGKKAIKHLDCQGPITNKDNRGKISFTS